MSIFTLPQMTLNRRYFLNPSQITSSVYIQLYFDHYEHTIFYFIDTVIGAFLLQKYVGFIFCKLYSARIFTLLANSIS